MDDGGGGGASASVMPIADDHVIPFSTSVDSSTSFEPMCSGCRCLGFWHLRSRISQMYNVISRGAATRPAYGVAASSTSRRVAVCE